MTAKKILSWLIAALVLIPCVLLAAINVPQGRVLFSNLATRGIGRSVTFTGHVYPLLSWPPALHVSGLAIANAEGGRDTDMVRIGTLEIAMGPKALLHGKFHIRRLALVDSEIHLERDANGKANWSFSSAPSSGSQPPSLGLLYFENSTLSYLDVAQGTDITLKGTTEGDQFSVTGGGKHLGKPFALKGQMTASCFSQHVDYCPLDVTMTVGHTSLHAQGKLDIIKPPDSADFQVDIKGADAAELFPLFGIALPPTAPYHLAGHLTYADGKWRFDDFKGKMGESDLKGNALWDTSVNPPKLTATVLSQKLRFADLGPLIGLTPTTPLSDEQKNRAAQRQASPYIIPDLPLDISKLSSMNADVEFTGKQVISDKLPLDDFYLKLSLDNLLMKLTPVRFGSAGGTISTDMTIDARQTPVKDHADISFNHLALGGLLHGAGSSLGNIEPATGDIGGTLTLSGEGKSLHEMLSHADGAAGLGMEGGSVSNLLIKLLSLDIARSLGFLLTGDKPLAIRCVAATFDVKQGVMNTDSFVVDTADTNIQASGAVNLHNEALALRIIPSPKSPTLLSLRSPIDIGGTLKKPSVTLEKGPLAARGAIATGIAALAPVAAVAAFIEPGMGKDSDCPALLSYMHAKTGKTTKTDEIPKNP